MVYNVIDIRNVPTVMVASWRVLQNLGLVMSEKYKISIYYSLHQGVGARTAWLAIRICPSGSTCISPNK